MAEYCDFEKRDRTRDEEAPFNDSFDRAMIVECSFQVLDNPLALSA